MPREMEPGDRCELTGENHQYAASVLRMKKGDNLLLFNGKGCEYEAVVLNVDRERVVLEIRERKIIRQDILHITLAQSLPKSRKMDFIVEKACELGVSRIIPFHSARSISLLTAEKAKLKQARWQKIALEAARKSHVPHLPEVGGIVDFAEMLRSMGDGAVKIIFWEEETRRSLKQVLRKEMALDGIRNDFFLIIGPEGGFSLEEIKLAESLGFVSVSLGWQILKVETVALAILAIIQYEREALGSSREGAGNP